MPPVVGTAGSSVKLNWIFPPPFPLVRFAALRRLSQPPPKVTQGNISCTMQSPPAEVWNSWQLTLAAKLTVAVWLWPFKVAVRVTVWLLLTDPELAEKVALLWPARMVTFAGTESNPLLLLSSDTTAAVVAGALNFTMQAVDRLLVNAAGVQDNDVSCTDAAAV